MHKSASLLPGLSFAAFVLWLLAVPMNGPLTASAGTPDALRWFLLPHVVALVLIGGFVPAPLFKRLAPVATVLTIFLSLLLPLFPALGAILLILVSISGAFVALNACRRLHCSPAPLFSSGAALVIANLALLGLYRVPSESIIPFILATLPLLLLLLPAGKQQPIQEDKSVKLWHYLPFILVFHLVSGLMYSVIYPAYQQVTVLGGAELPFYMAAVIGAVAMVRISREIPLILGVVLGMGAFILLQWNHPSGIFLSMFAMQAGQGFIDLFLLAFLLRFPDPLRAFSFGLATLCLGIYGGQILGNLLQTSAGTVALFGHLFLNLAVLTLYLLNRRRSLVEAGTQAVAEPVPTALQASSFPDEDQPTATDAGQITIPEHLRLLLSEREQTVLIQSLDGTTYKDIALQLKISESSVKTYMKRICDKFEVTSRKNLVRLLFGKES